MSTPCDPLPLFADGDLPLEESQAFGRHLAECKKCQEELTRILQLDQMGRRYIERHGPVEIPWHVVPRNRWRVAGAAAAVCAGIALVLTLGLPGRGGSREEPALWAGTQRSLEARMTYPAADQYRRPVQVMMGGTAAVSSARTLSVLNDLEKRGDLPQLVAACLAVGKPDPDCAKGFLKKMKSEGRWDAANMLSDLGVAHYASAKLQGSNLVLQELREALSLFNQALLLKPTHPQALWNRALVYGELGLPLLAMKDLDSVQRSETAPGWQAEARARRTKLAGVLSRKERWEAADKAGAELVEKGAQALQGALQYADTPLMRRDFYHAVRTRTSREEVLALLPLAETLDQKTGLQPVLATYLQTIAGRDFTLRAPLAADYARLLSGTVPPAEQEAMLKAFLASGEDDIALGALVLMPRRPGSENSAQLIARARDSKDPWFQVLGLQEEASQQRQKDRDDLALGTLERALDLCTRERLVYRCIEVRNDLAYVAGWRFQLEDAERHARKGLALARLGQWDQERMLLQALGSVARNSADVILGRAYFEEALLMGVDPKSELNIHQNLAHLAIHALELDEARREIDRALAVGLPLTRHGVAALADVARTRRASGDAEAVQRALAVDTKVTDGQRAYVKFLRGRFLLEVEPASGRALLAQAIDEAAQAEEAARSAGWLDVEAQHARAYSHTSLIFDDARHGDFASALGRFGTELGFTTPDRCVLGLTEDTERSLLVGRGAQGQLLKAYTPVRSARFPLDMAGVVPTDMLKALAPCATVDVLARPPLQGRSGLLPPTMAWRYRTLVAARQPPAGRGVHLVVNEVRYDEQRNETPLKWNAKTSPDEDLLPLRDLEATPSRVLAEMPKATEIVLATHGKVAPGSRASYLLLAPEADGTDTLSEDRIRKLKLTRAPLVILAACEAARGTAALHEPGSLPNAFLAAGARGVVAATISIPDEDSSEFFGNVRERLWTGASLSAAVRDERLQWLQRNADTNWVNGVLVFE